MHILLWERNLNVVLVQGVVDGCEYLTGNNATHQGFRPDEQLEVDAAVTQLRDTDKGIFCRVCTIQMKVVDGAPDAPTSFNASLAAGGFNVGSLTFGVYYNF